MFLRKALRPLFAALVMSVALLGGQAVAAPSGASQSSLAPRVVTYDASGSAEFADAVDSGAAVWNESVANVELRPAAAGERANVRVIADDGWPRAITTSLGNGTVYMGRQAVAEGHDTVRIAAHELGHILGLPDIKPGPCSSLMSGASAGTSCTNAYPDAAEKAEVEDNFASGAADSRTRGKPRVYLNY